VLWPVGWLRPIAHLAAESRPDGERGARGVHSQLTSG